MSDPIPSGRLNDYRQAAEKAWGDDTRHEQFIGHPQPSHGNCFVTSQWLANKVGGFVGTKDGHYFTVTKDKQHVVDLSGDWFAHPPVPEHLSHPEDDPHHKTWRPGPVMHKRADHPLYKGFRILNDHSHHPRAQLFARRADLALSGERVSSVHVADLMGPSGLQTPQQQEDYAMQAPMPMLHDEPAWDPQTDPKQEYKWVFANGQIHVSPVHDHDEMIGHAGAHPESNGPVAVGYVNVSQGHALWQVESNVSLHGLHKLLTEYSDTVGWKFDGMVGTDGSQLHDDFGPKKSMWYTSRKDGHLLMSERPLPRGRHIRIAGKTAYVNYPLHDGVKEWAQDFGYRLAEYPGGGDMLDKMRPKENLDTYNRGDTDFQPERTNPDQDLGDSLHCGECGQKFNRIEDLRLHVRDHEPQDKEEIQDGHFPHVQPFDIPLGFGTQPVQNGGLTIAHAHSSSSPLVVLVTTRRSMARHPRFSTYAGLFGYDTDEGIRFYGAYRQGQLVGYGAIRLASERGEPEALMIDALEYRSGIGSAILSLMQTHFDAFYTHADSEAGERLMRRMGMVNTESQLWRWSKGDQPKDMITAAVPFIYDAHQHWIHIGYPGQRTADIQGKFTPGQIIEGYYEPGGKMILIPSGNALYSTRQIAELWYHRFPQMEITSVERETPEGKTHKIASESVGNYIRALLPSDQAAHNAAQALREAGGKVYVVGGAVRDALQQREPKDIDLMVAGLPPEKVEHVLNQLSGTVNLTGKRFGVYRYKVGGREVEVALPRQDQYETARRGEGVITVDHNLPIEKDLERRDFTANSLAVDLDDGRLIDPFGGARDIESNVLRTTHPDSFREDPTRIVRALAMHGRFGLQPDERTRHEMETNGHLLRNESPDALNKVLDKTFASHNPAGAIRLGADTGVLQHILPEVTDNFHFDQNNPHHNYKLGEHLLHVLDNVSQSSTDPDLRLAALYHDVGKPASEWRDPATGVSHYYQGPEGQGANHEDVGARMTSERMRSLNYPTARINRVAGLIQGHMFPAFNTPRGARKFLQKQGPLADDLLHLREADMGGKGQGPEYFAARTSVDKMRELVDQSRREQAPTDIQNLAINGNDLIAMGITPGPEIGKILRSLVDAVVEQPTLNDRTSLLELAESYAQASPNSNPSPPA